MRFKEPLLTLKPYQPGKSIGEVKKEYNLKEIVKLSSNENPFGCSPEVLSVFQNSFPNLALYPDGYATNLRSSLSNFLRVKEDELIFGNGSDELIQIISKALLGHGVNTVMAAPTFPQYRHNAVIVGADLREIPLKNGEHDLEEMIAAIDENTNVVWVCSPNNPTGTYVSQKNLLQFLERVPNHVLVVLDEAYYEYVDADDYYDSVSLIRSFSNLIVLRTFSKIYGLAALRVGYGIANPAIIQALDPAREPFNVNSFALLAAQTAIEDQNFVKECKEKNREGLMQFYLFCEANELTYFPSQGNFILIDFKEDADQVFQFLLERGYIVRSGKALGFPTSVRITVGSSGQNLGVLSVIREYLASK